MGVLNVSNSLQDMEVLKQKIRLDKWNKSNQQLSFMQQERVNKENEFVKLAELGKLALTTQPCYYEYQYNDGDCHMEKCSSCELCRVRAEMLRGKV